MFTVAIWFSIKEMDATFILFLSLLMMDAGISITMGALLPLLLYVWSKNETFARVSDISSNCEIPPEQR